MSPDRAATPLAAQTRAAGPEDPPRSIPTRAPRSDEALIEHGVRDLEEAADVGAVEQIAGGAVLGRGLEAVAVDLDHDLVQPLVHLVAAPRQPHAVLRHL